MKMIIGGSFQGKLQYAKKTYPDITWADGRDCPYDAVRTCGGISHLETYIRRLMEEEEKTRQRYLDTLEELGTVNPEIVIVSDEVGYGLVPADPFERAYREKVGRICTRLAACADQVDRVVCGIAVTIKKNSSVNKSNIHASMAAWLVASRE